MNIIDVQFDNFTIDEISIRDIEGNEIYFDALLDNEAIDWLYDLRDQLNVVIKNYEEIQIQKDNPDIFKKGPI